MPTGKSDRRVREVDEVDEAEEGIDLAKLKMILGFFLRAPRRRPRLALVAPVVVLLLVFGIAAWMPRTYTADMRVIAHRSGVLPEHEGVPQTEPTVGVADEILKRDNIESLVKNLDLISRWDAARPPALRLKDWVFGFGRASLSPEEKGRALVASLEKNLQVSVDQNAITIACDWPNPQVAFDVVNMAYKEFLDARAESEVNFYSERLRVLEMRSQFAAQDVDTAIAELTKREDEHRHAMGGEPNPAPPPAAQGGDAVPLAPGVAPKPAPPDTSASDEVAHALEDVRAQIRVAEEDRRRRSAEAEAQLADAQGTYGPLHPTVLSLKHKVEAAHEASPQLEALRAQEKDLVSKLAADVPPPASSSSPAPQYPQYRPASPSPTTPGVPNELREMLLNRDDAATAYARTKLQATSQQYNDILGRMQLAKIELDVARESFKETYTVVRPAELPAKPRKPNVTIIVVMGVLGAALLVFLVPGARDLLAGRILEPWQVETVLKIPVLGALPPADSLRPPAHDAGTSP